MSLLSRITKPLSGFSDRIHGVQILSAIHDNNLEQLKKLLSENNIEGDPEGRLNLLSVARDSNNYTAVKIMFDNGFDPNQKTKSNESLLYEAAKSGDYLFAKILIDAGANVDSLNGSKQRTPLMAACSAGYPDIVELLINAKADLNSFDRSPKNKLDAYDQEMVAISNNLNKNASAFDPEALMKESHSLANPLMIAASGERSKRLYSITALVENGADVDAQNDYGVSFKQLMESRYDQEVIDLLHAIKEQNELEYLVANEDKSMPSWT